MKIYFQNFGCCIYKNKIKKIFYTALEKVGLDFKGFSVNLKFTSQQEIQNLNKTFREHDKITDVLSFPALNLEKGQGISPKELAQNLSPDDGLVLLGDIAICKSVCKRAAKEYRHTFKREVCFLALHGFLHLLGFDHLTPKDEEEMQNITKEILTMQKVKRNV